MGPGRENEGCFHDQIVPTPAPRLASNSAAEAVRASEILSHQRIRGRGPSSRELQFALKSLVAN